MSKVSEERAQELYQEMVDTFGNEPDAEQIPVVMRGIRAGRLEFDAANETFEIHLVKPVKLQNGDTVDSFTIEEPTTEQISKADNRPSDMAKTINLVSSVSRHPVTVIERIRMRDISLAGAVVSFFG